MFGLAKWMSSRLEGLTKRFTNHSQIASGFHQPYQRFEIRRHSGYSVGAPANFVKEKEPTTGRVQALSSTSRMIIIYIG